MNIAEIEIQLAELVEQPFDKREFALRLLEIYNAPKATLTKLRTLRVRLSVDTDATVLAKETLTFTSKK